MTFLLFLAGMCAAAAGRDFFVSPTGKSSGDGSIGNPWDLETALGQPAVLRPGDTVWLCGGRYGDGSGRRPFVSRIKGTASRPIVVRGRVGERATIDGGLVLEGGESAWYRDFEITSSETDRRGGTDGSTRLPEGVVCRAPRTRLINLVIHDAAQGIGFWREAPDSEAYGNLIYYNGHQSTARGHGHGIYFQNKEGAKLLAENIVFGQFGSGLHGYGTESAFVRNVAIEGNIVFSNGVLSAREQYVDNMILGPGSALTGIVVRDNLTYFPERAAGYSRIGTEFSPANGDVTVTGNLFIGGFIGVMMSRWREAAFTGNTVYSANGHLVMLEIGTGAGHGAYRWNGNTYYGRELFSEASPQRSLDWNEWRKATGFDAASRYHPGRPKGVWTFVRPNRYDGDRAHIAIYNWDLAARAEVDLSGILAPGDRFEIRDAQNYYGDPVVQARFEGGPTAIPMRGLAAARPHGNTPTGPRHTAPEFAAFILIRAEGAK